MPGTLSRTVLLILFLSLCFSCRKDPDLLVIDNLSGNKVMVFGHGGMGYRSKLPMNSEQSLNECLAKGADGAEMDVQMTTDSVLYLYHDVDLEDATTCHGRIDEQDATSLNGCKYKKNGKKHKLITVSSFFEQCSSKDIKMFTLECKLGKSDLHVFARTLLSLINKYNLGDRCFIESVEPEFIRLIEEADPKLQTYIYAQNHQVALDLRNMLTFDGLTISMDLINATQIREVHEQGLKVSLFSMGTQKQNIDALEMSPDNIQTDKVEHLVEVYVKKR